MDIFARENIGRHIRCLLEKDGERAVDMVKWTHAMTGEVIHRMIKSAKTPEKPKKMGAFGKTPNIYVSERSDGWTVVEVGV